MIQPVAGSINHRLSAPPPRTSRIFVEMPPTEPFPPATNEKDGSLACWATKYPLRQRFLSISSFCSEFKFCTPLGRTINASEGEAAVVMMPTELVNLCQ